MYNPKEGRWTQPDPIEFEGEDYNLYRYVGNNPTNLTDPSGKIAFGPRIDLGTTLEVLSSLFTGPPVTLTRVPPPPVRPDVAAYHALYGNDSIWGTPNGWSDDTGWKEDSASLIWNAGSPLNWNLKPDLGIRKPEGLLSSRITVDKAGLTYSVKVKYDPYNAGFPAGVLGTPVTGVDGTGQTEVDWIEADKVSVDFVHLPADVTQPKPPYKYQNESTGSRSITFEFSGKIPKGSGSIGPVGFLIRFKPRAGQDIGPFREQMVVGWKIENIRWGPGNNTITSYNASVRLGEQFNGPTLGKNPK